MIGGNVFLGNALFVALAGNAANITVNGTMTSGIAPAISITSSNYAINPPLISGIITNVNGINAIDSPGLKLLNNASTVWTFQTNDSLTNEILYTADELTGYPPESKVENGFIYGPTDEFEGTLEQVDTSQLAIDLLTEISNSTLPLAERLRNVSTISTVNTAISSINIIP